MFADENAQLCNHHIRLGENGEGRSAPQGFLKVAGHESKVEGVAVTDVLWRVLFQKDNAPCGLSA
jgi:hypothetical protein